MKERIDITDKGRGTALTDQLIGFFSFIFGGPVLSAHREGTAWHPPQIYSGAILWCALVLLPQWLIR